MINLSFRHGRKLNNFPSSQKPNYLRKRSFSFKKNKMSYNNFKENPNNDEKRSINDVKNSLSVCSLVSN